MSNLKQLIEELEGMAVNPRDINTPDSYNDLVYQADEADEDGED